MKKALATAPIAIGRHHDAAMIATHRVSGVVMLITADSGGDVFRLRLMSSS